MDQSAPSLQDAPATAANAVTILHAIRRLHAAGGSLLSQLALHAELARIGWAEERQRLLGMLLALMLGFAFLICFLLAGGIVLLTLGWDTAWRMPLVLVLLAAYGGGIALAWRQFTQLAAREGQAFAASREEFAADLELLRSKL